MAFLSSLSYSTNTVLKKALLFGLSRYGVLDFDASKLEKQLNVDFSMRKPTVVELRGVGIHVKTLLSKLTLQLPDDLEVTKAQILLLRLTIPPDFYRSSIAVDIEGVVLHTTLVLKKSALPKPATFKESHGKGIGSETSHRKTRRRKASPAPHDPGGYLSSDDDIDAALTAQDLAKSFLQHEPVETKIQLEAAINAQPDLLQESMSSSGYTEDGEVLGTGAGLSLPGFLTNFFQGPSPLHDFPQKVSADKDNKAQALMVPVTAESRTESGSSGGTRQKSLSPVEDLSVSRVYSHTDAESMYMSAMSEASDQGNKDFSIPGGWDAASVSTGDSESPLSHQVSQENMAGSVIFNGVTNVADEQPTPRQSSNAGAARGSVLPPLPSKHGEIPSEERRTEPITRSSLGRSSTPQGFSHHAPVESKQFLGIDEVLIWLPDPTKTQVERDTASPDIVGSVHSRAGASTTAASFRRNMPGAFSQYVEESIGRSQVGPVTLEDSAFSSASSKPAPKGHTQGLEVEIGSIDGQLDAPAGRLIYEMIQRFLSALNERNSSTFGETASPESAFT
ncbi:autophagy- protein 2, partial [Cryomyces antarcticus]